MTDRHDGGQIARVRLLSALSRTLVWLAFGLSVAAAQPTQLAYVTSEGSGDLSVVDVDAFRAVRGIEVGARPHNIEATNSGLLVVATQGSNAVSVVDLKSDPAKVTRIDIGARPHDLAGERDGDVLAVSESGLLAEFDPVSSRILRTVELEGAPHNVTALQGAAWITDTSARRLFIVEGETAQELPISIEGHGLAVRPGSDELWVTPWSGDRTVIVDVRSRNEVGGLRVGFAQSHKHLAFSEDGREAWITEPESGSLFVVDTQTKQLVETIDLKGHPHHVRFAAGRAYVAVGPGELVVLDAATRQVVGRVAAGSEVHDVAVPTPVK